MNLPRHPLLRYAAFLFFFLPGLTQAQEAEKVALSVWAEVQESPATITLHWSDPAYAIDALEVRRRAGGSGNFTTIATLATTDRTYADTGVSVGQTYEYAVVARFAASTGLDHATGYVLASIKRPLVESRGRLLFVQESSAASALANELPGFYRELAGDGWDVVPLTVQATDTAAAVKAAITAEHNQAAVAAILLFGRVPIPYSGRLAPDGHSSHIGANPADGYYGDFSGTWTDTQNPGDPGTPYGRSNVASDGRWDHNAFPALLTVPVGRIDLRDMPSFGGTEHELLARYIEKNRDYRNARTAYPRRGFASTNWGSTGDIRSNPAIRAYAPMFGTANITSTVGSSWAFRNTLKENAYAFAFGTGAGTFDSADNTVTTGDIARSGVQAPFIFLFGSYFYDTDFSNNLLRAAIAQPTHGLASGWGVRPNWIFHTLGLGATIGDCLLRTQNKVEAATFDANASDQYWTGFESSGSFNKGVWITLMGDPALRLHPVAPPTNVAAVGAAGTVNLTWSASSDAAVIGYHIYRSSEEFGGYTRISPETPVTATAFTDSAAPAAPAWYQVRAIKLESTPSGTYYNSSQGAYAALFASSPAASPANVTAEVISSGEIRLAWDYAGADTAYFQIERNVNGGGWTVAGRTDGAETTFHDASASAGVPHSYRITPLNNAGNGAPSDPVSVTPSSTAPTAPDELRLVPVGAGRISLEWRDTSGTATGFRIERKQATTGTWAEIGSTAQGVTVFENTGLTQGGVTYFYRVRAESAEGLSPYSSEVSFRTLPSAPLLADPFDDGFYWNGSDLYDQEWARRYAETLLAVVPDDDLDPGEGSSVLEVDQFTVRTTKATHLMVPFTSTTLAVGEGLRLSLKLRFTGPARTNNSATGIALSSAPAGTFTGNSYSIQTSFGADSANLGIIRKDVSTNIINNDAGDADIGATLASKNLGTTVHAIVFEVFRAGTDQVEIRYQLDGGDILLRTDAASVHTVFQSAVFRYFFTSGTEKLHLDDVQVVKVTSPLVAPDAPTGLAATPTVPGGISLAWTDSATTETGYRIERSTTPGAGFLPVAWLNANATGYSDAGLAEGTTYYYKVFAEYYTAASSPAEAGATTTSTTPGLPEVGITAPDAAASESGDTGQFTVTRTGATTDPLTVQLAASGSATAGADYTALPSSVTIPAGESSATLTVTPIDDNIVEANTSETVVLSITTDAAYTIGPASSATVNIAENDTAANTNVANVAVAVASDTSVTLTWSDNFETNTKYRVRRSTSADMSGATGFDAGADATSHTFTGLTPGTTYYFQIRAEKTTATTYTGNWSTTLSATPSAANSWLQTHFASTDPAQWTADPDADGSANILEYALGNDPTDPTDPNDLSLATSGNHLTLTFTPAVTTGLHYIVESSSDLAAWSATDITASLTPGSAYTFSDPADLATTPRRFLRLRIEIVP